MGRFTLPNTKELLKLRFKKLHRSNMKMQKYVVSLVLDILQCVSLFTTRTGMEELRFHIHRINSTDWKLYSGISQLVVNSSRRSITVQTFARDYLRAIKRNAFHYILIQIQNSFSTTIDITTIFRYSMIYSK